jgi:hypothetical protein
MCIRCSGIHRSLGSHISFVRSVSLDEWKEKQVENMVRWGNRRANEYWEALVPEEYYIPTEEDPVQQVERWIRDKYEKGKFKAKAKPRCADAEVNLVGSMADIMAQASGTKEKKAKAVDAAAVGGGGGGGAPKIAGAAAAVLKAPAPAAAPKAPATAAADPFDLLGFDAFPVAPAKAAAVPAQGAGVGDLFATLGGGGAAAAPAPAPATSKAADIMQLFGTGGGGSAPPPQQLAAGMAGLSLAPAPAADPFAAFAPQPARVNNPFAMPGAPTFVYNAPTAAAAPSTLAPAPAAAAKKSALDVRTRTSSPPPLPPPLSFSQPPSSTPLHAFPFPHSLTPFRHFRDPLPPPYTHTRARAVSFLLLFL